MNNAWEILRSRISSGPKTATQRSGPEAMRLYVRTLRSLGCLWVLSTVLYASDQTVIISQTPRVCSGLPQSITLANSEGAILAALNIEEVDHNTYYMIHDVSYNPDGSVMEQHWYVYLYDWSQKHTILENLEDTRIRHHFEEARIYGSHQVAIVYFHRVLGISEDTATERANLQIGTLATADPTDPSPVDASDIQALIHNKVIGGDANAAGHKRIAAYDLVNSSTGNKMVGFQPPGQTPYVVDTTFVNVTKSVTYTIDITKQVPAPIQNLEGIAKLVVGAQGESKSLRIAVDQIALCGGQAFQVTPLPSLMNVSSTVSGGDKKVEIGKNTYDNEQKYWYDFSLALPLKSFNDLTVDSSNLTLTAKSVQKQNLFAMVNLSLPYDTKKANFQLIPVFLYGVPITGKPLNHHLVAGAVGLNRVQFFVGVMFNHNKTVPSAPVTPPGITNGTSTGSGTVKDSWNAKLSYGINFPVSTITNLLKKK